MSICRRVNAVMTNGAPVGRVGLAAEEIAILQL